MPARSQAQWDLCALAPSCSALDLLSLPAMDLPVLAVSCVCNPASEGSGKSSKSCGRSGASPGEAIQACSILAGNTVPQGAWSTRVGAAAQRSTVQNVLGVAPEGQWLSCLQPRSTRSHARAGGSCCWCSPASPVSSRPLQSGKRLWAVPVSARQCQQAGQAQDDSARERARSCPSGPPNSASSRLLSRVSDPSKQPESRGMSPLSSEGKGWASELSPSSGSLAAGGGRTWH